MALLHRYVSVAISPLGGDLPDPDVSLKEGPRAFVHLERQRIRRGVDGEFSTSSSPDSRPSDSQSSRDWVGGCGR